MNAWAWLWLFAPGHEGFLLEQTGGFGVQGLRAGAQTLSKPDTTILLLLSCAPTAGSSSRAEIYSSSTSPCGSPREEPGWGSLGMGLAMEPALVKASFFVFTGATAII